MPLTTPRINKLLLLITLLTIGFAGFAQTPNLLNYQGVARNAVGNPLPNQTMTLRVSIRNNSFAGPVVYTETRTVQTNLGGLFAVQIGSAGAISSFGTIAGVNWQVGLKFLQVEVDPKADNHFLDMGTEQLLSVPYAFNGISVEQANAIIANTAKVGITPAQSTAIVANSAKVGISIAQADAIVANTAKVGITPAQASAIVVNSAKVGITTAQADAIVANTAKVGISPAQASAIVVNSAKVGITTAQADMIIANQNALNLKANLASPSFTGTVTIPTLIAGSNTFPSNRGSANQILTTDGIGTLSWTNSTSSGVPYTGATGSVNLGAFDLTVNGLKVGKGAGTNSQNTALGNASLGLNTTGTVNSAVGFESLKSNTTGAANTAFGAYALLENQTGARNTAVGSQALQLTNSAYDNTAIGNLTAVANTSGSYNTAVGSNSLLSNTAGRDNTSVGYEALRLNQANGNTASGYQSMRQNIGGGRNTALGYTALYSNTTASYNVAVGAQALGGATSGERNVAIGAGALDANVTGSYNTVLGGFAGRYFAGGLTTMDFSEPANGPHMNTKMDNSILIGAWAKPNANNETNEIVIGFNAIGNGSNTIQLGNTGITNVKTSGTLTAGTITYPNTNGNNGQVLTANSNGTASWTTVSGGVSSIESISGTSNVKGATISGTAIMLTPADASNGGIVTTGTQIFSGAKTFSSIDGWMATGTFGSGTLTPTSGAGTRMVWYPRKSALRAGTVGSTQWDDTNIGNYSTAMGYSTTASGEGSAAIGNSSRASGNYSTAMGYESIASGSVSTAIGNSSSASGNYSTAMGQSSTASGTVGTAMGYSNTASGEVSTALGRFTNASGFASTTMGEHTTAKSFAETVIGIYNTNYTSTATYGNQFVSTDRLFVIGNGTSSSSTSDALVMLKNGNTTFSGTVTASVIAPTSDKRLKRNIAPLLNSIDAIMQLKPVSYEKKSTLASTDYSIKENGFIAQELQKIMPNLVIEGTDKDKLLSLNYTALIPVLTKAIQEQQKQIEELKLLVLSLKK